MGLQEPLIPLSKDELTKQDSYTALYGYLLLPNITRIRNTNCSGAVGVRFFDSRQAVWISAWPFFSCVTLG